MGSDKPTSMWESPFESTSSPPPSPWSPSVKLYWRQREMLSAAEGRTTWIWEKVRERGSKAVLLGTIAERSSARRYAKFLKFTDISIFLVSSNFGTMFTSYALLSSPSIFSLWSRIPSDLAMWMPLQEFVRSRAQRTQDSFKIRMVKSSDAETQSSSRSWLMGFGSNSKVLTKENL